jgi:membrane protease YdiL (CAAX protease family)
VRAALVSQIVAVALAAYLVRGSLLALRRWRAFQRSTEPAKRERLFRNLLLREALALAAALSACSLDGLRLRTPPNPEGWALEFLAAVGGSLVLSVLFFLFTRRGRRLRDRLMGTLGAMAPESAAERRLFIVVALQAGPVEEILYRGFVLAFLQWLGVTSWPILIGASALLFGLGHAYQKIFGVVVTSLLGALFALIALETGSLYVPIIVHTLVDLRGLLLLWSRRATSS